MCRLRGWLFERSARAIHSKHFSFGCAPLISPPEGRRDVQSFTSRCDLQQAKTELLELRQAFGVRRPGRQEAAGRSRSRNTKSIFWPPSVSASCLLHLPPAPAPCSPPGPPHSKGLSLLRKFV